MILLGDKNWSVCFLMIGLVFGCNTDDVPEKPAEADVRGKTDPESDAGSKDTLKFKALSGETNVAVAELIRKWGTKEINSQDKYYRAMKRYRAIPLALLIREYFKLPDSKLQSSQFLFQATDGYAVRISGATVLNPAAYLAVADLDHSNWQPIGERGAHPGPLYMVWEGTEFADHHKYPRPWALAQIELLAGADRYTHTRPSSGFGDDELAKKGYEIFDLNCIRCHSINQEGGAMGPDLNVPQNILAYRPEKQVREYIMNPRIFRYSAMPAHPDLGEQELDALIAYLKLMGEYQHDPHENNSKKAD